MSWMEISHPCQFPSMFEISNKQAGPGSTWQCDEPKCHKIWELAPEGIWFQGFDTFDQESKNAEVESGDESTAGAGKTSSVPEN